MCLSVGLACFLSKAEVQHSHRQRYAVGQFPQESMQACEITASAIKFVGFYVDHNQRQPTLCACDKHDAVLSAASLPPAEPGSSRALVCSRPPIVCLSRQHVHQSRSSCGDDARVAELPNENKERTTPGPHAKFTCEIHITARSRSHTSQTPFSSCVDGP